MIESIDEAHPDHARIYAALRINRCPDCDAHGFEPGPRGGMSRNYFCLSCGSGFNVAPDLMRPMFIQRIGRKQRHAG